MHISCNDGWTQEYVNVSYHKIWTYRYQKDINHFVLFTRSKLLIVQIKVFINVYSIEWNKIV